MSGALNSGSGSLISLAVLLERLERIDEGLDRRAHDAAADDADPGLPVGDTGVQGGQDAGLGDLAGSMPTGVPRKPSAGIR
jgi:hypothetical protein